jgi:hypothetical protein
MTAGAHAVCHTIWILDGDERDVEKLLLYGSSETKS